MSNSQNYSTMAANTKYQPAPQRDSFEDEEQRAGLSQAPPAYEAEAATDAALLSGVARSEYDNVPDDFKVGGFLRGACSSWASC